MFFLSCLTRFFEHWSESGCESHLQVSSQQ